MSDKAKSRGASNKSDRVIGDKLSEKSGGAITSRRTAPTGTGTDSTASFSREALVKRLNLKAAGYVCSGDLQEKVQLALLTRPVGGAFLFGPPGVGKTFLAETVAHSLNIPLLVQQMFPGTQEEDLLIRLIIDENGEPRGAPGVLIQAARLLEAGTPAVLLLLDEWDKARPAADAFLLDFLQTGRIRFRGQKYDLPLERLFVFITSDEERTISEPLLRRLPRLDLTPPPLAEVDALLRARYPDHPHLEKALALYAVSLEKSLHKPVTLQELYQLLDALSRTSLPWEDAVYMFVTKSPRDHQKLMTPSQPRLAKSEDRDDSDEEDTDFVEIGHLRAYRIVARYRGHRLTPEPLTMAAYEQLLPEIYGTVRGTPWAYTAAVRIAKDQGRAITDPARPGIARLVEVAGSTLLIFHEPLSPAHLGAFLMPGDPAAPQGEIAVHLSPPSGGTISEVVQFILDEVQLSTHYRTEEACAFVLDKNEIYLSATHCEALVQVPLTETAFLQLNLIQLLLQASAVLQDKEMYLQYLKEHLLSIQGRWTDPGDPGGLIPLPGGELAILLHLPKETYLFLPSSMLSGERRSLLSRLRRGEAHADQEDVELMDEAVHAEWGETVEWMPRYRYRKMHRIPRPAVGEAFMHELSRWINSLSHHHE